MNTSFINVFLASVFNAVVLTGFAGQSAQFLPQVAESDRVLVSHTDIGARLVLTGSQALTLSRSISQAKGPPAGLHLAASCQAEFYQGGNFLARIWFENGYFETNSAQFVTDESGALSALQKRLEHDKTAQTNWTGALVEAAQEAGLGDLQKWRVYVLEHDQTKRAVAQASERGEAKREIPIPFGRPPSEFAAVGKALFIPEPNVSVLLDPYKKSDLVLLSWGDQYGFFVGPTSGYVAVFDAEQITNFAPGVCAFHRGNYYYK